MRIFFFVFLISFKIGTSQTKSESLDSSNSSFAFSLGAERIDFYTTFTYIKSIESFSVNPSLGFGIIHSVFQSNPFFRVGADVYYNILDKSISSHRQMILGIGTGYYFSFYNRPSFTKHHEICAGSLFRIGGRIKFCQTTSIGILNESF